MEAQFFHFNPFFRHFSKENLSISYLDKCFNNFNAQKGVMRGRGKSVLFVLQDLGKKNKKQSRELDQQKITKQPTV